MTSTAVACPSCGYRFNYRFVPGVSVTAVRVGAGRGFRCPHCGARALFRLDGTPPDPTRPTYEDPVAGPAMLGFLALVGAFVATVYAASVYLIPPWRGTVEVGVGGAILVGGIALVLRRSGSTPLRPVALQ